MLASISHITYAPTATPAAPIAIAMMRKLRRSAIVDAFCPAISYFCFCFYAMFLTPLNFPHYQSRVLHKQSDCFCPMCKSCNMAACRESYLPLHAGHGPFCRYFLPQMTHVLASTSMYRLRMCGMSSLIATATAIPIRAKYQTIRRVRPREI